MLSRETCEALVEKFPEVRAHEWRSSDLYYIPYYTISEPWIVIGSLAPSPGSTWCPRLEDLLAVAGKHAGCMHLRQNAASPWGFSDCHEDCGAPEDAGRGPTPEEAVAAWLLARA